MPSCWVCSCVVLPICLYVSPAFLIGEPRKPGCWSLIPDAGSVSGGLRPCTAGSLSSDWLVLLPPAWHFPLGDWFLSEQAGPGVLRRPHGVPLLTTAPGPFLAEARLCHPELGPCSRGSPRTQSPCPLPGLRGCPIGCYLAGLCTLEPALELCVLDLGRRSPGAGDVPSRSFPLQLRGWELVHCRVWGQVSGSQGPVDTSLGSSCLLLCHHGRCVHLVTGGSTTKGARSTVVGCRHQGWSWSC